MPLFPDRVLDEEWKYRLSSQTDGNIVEVNNDSRQPPELRGRVVVKFVLVSRILVGHHLQRFAVGDRERDLSPDGLESEDASTATLVPGGFHLVGATS